MAWIESHQELGRHPKTRRLARQLNISRPAAVGHLHYLWWWALDFAQDGSLARYDADEIAEAALWDGDADAFLHALIDAGFVDHSDKRCVLHDWDDYAGKLLDQRKSNARRQQDWRNRHKTTPDDNAEPSRNSNVTVTSPLRNGATVPNHTVPNPNVTADSESISLPFAPDADASAAQPGEPHITPSPEPNLRILRSEAEDVSPPDAASPPKREKAPAARTRDPIWDALVDVFGYEPESTAERSKWGKVVRDLKKAQATGEEVRRRFSNHAHGIEAGAIHWTLTPNALVAHWGELNRVPEAPVIAHTRMAAGARETPRTMNLGPTSPWG